MYYLAIDTSNLLCSCAIFQDQNLLVHKENKGEANQARDLLNFIGELLKASNLNLKQIDAIFVSTGPGSFTGIRVGIAAAQGLALALGVKLYGISNFDAAFHATSDNIVAFDAGRGEYYMQRKGEEPYISSKLENASLSEIDSVKIGFAGLSLMGQKDLFPIPLYVRTPNAKKRSSS